MGLFDFVKEAGEKLFGADEAKAATPAAPAMSKSAMLLSSASSMGLLPEGGSIQFNDGVATLKGVHKTQSDKEKLVLLVGNTQGVAQVDDQTTVEGAEPEATMYTVKSGDSLSKIAKEHYGDAMKYPVIFEANKPMLTDPNKIYPGQVLRIPPV